MHGVSDAFASEVFKRAGFKPYIAVEEQKLPDPNFPTVRFPNPEEKGMEYIYIAATSLRQSYCRGIGKLISGSS